MNLVNDLGTEIVIREFHQPFGKFSFSGGQLFNIVDRIQYFALQTVNKTIREEK